MVKKCTGPKKMKGICQYDWLHMEFFIGRSLHYGQDFSSGEFQAWPPKNFQLEACLESTCMCVCVWGAGRVWACALLHLLVFYYLILFESNFIPPFSPCPSYQPLPQITLFWVESLDQLVHFFTIV